MGEFNIVVIAVISRQSLLGQRGEVKPSDSLGSATLSRPGSDFRPSPEAKVIKISGLDSCNP